MVHAGSFLFKFLLLKKGQTQQKSRIYKFLLTSNFKKYLVRRMVEAYIEMNVLLQDASHFNDLHDLYSIVWQYYQNGHCCNIAKI